jgi:glycosyltransferase involved in cell wall biosynthesis
MAPDVKYTFTVFTPTYNRASVLYRPYRALCAQTFRDFEWLIVDDGSTDGTQMLVDEWRHQAQVKIRYEYQPNQGKHAACNRAVDLADGEFFLPLDSDDACVPTALERLKHYWDSIPPGIRAEFSGVCALCVDQYGKIVGDRFPCDVLDSNSLEVVFRYGIKGEKWGFHRTAIMRKFRFPIIENASFIPESLVWFATARQYKERYINEVLRVYWIEPSGSTEQLTARFDALKHSPGRHLYYKMLLNEYPDWVCRAPLQFSRIAANYIRMALHLGHGFRNQIADIHPWVSKALCMTALPVGIILYLSDKYA